MSVAPTATDLRNLVARGLPVSLLADVFGCSKHTVRRKVANLKPVGGKEAEPLYDLREAAEVLVKPKGDMAEYIKNLRPQDVPPALQKQFWDAQNSRLKYMEDAGQLWHTTRVQMAIGELFKLIRQRVQLLADTTERQIGLTDAQRAIIEGMSDSLLEDLHEQIIALFAEMKLDGERDETFENGPPMVSFDDDEEPDPSNNFGSDHDPYEGL